MEPYLINNPPRRRRRKRHGRKPKGHKAGCRCFACAGHPRRSRRHGRRRRRRNPGAVMYGLNPKRRRRGGRRRHSRRRYRRNPGAAITRPITEALPKVGWGVAGALGTQAIPVFASRFVPLPQGRVGSLLVKVGTGLGLSMVIRRFAGKAAGNAAFIGALIPIVLEQVQPFIAGVMPGGALSLAPEAVGAYLPADAYLTSGMGYSGPGATFGDIDQDGDAVPDRLEPMGRF